MEQSKKLREFHNDVKLKLLTKYSHLSNAKTVLDIGTGRGGDMHKWHKCNIQNVIGIDINKHFIEEAIKRCKYAKYLMKRSYMFYYTRPDEIFEKYLQKREITHVFDCITSMFAFHYFFKNEVVLDDILRQISSHLKPDGFFIGVCPQGERIKEMLGNKLEFKNDVVYLKKTEKMTKSIGEEIKFMLSGTLYFGDNIMSNEYLVYEETLKKHAEKYNLKLLEYKNFNEYYDINYRLDEMTKSASFLNGTFVLQKC